MNDFDQKAQDWDKNKMHLERTIAVASQLKNQVTLIPGMKALEFGAGTGLLSFQLKDKFSEITLMDNSEEMLKIAAQKMNPSELSKFKSVYLNLELEDYSGGQFDIVYNQMALHHVRNIEAIFRKFYHLLKSGGILAIADLYMEDGSFHDGDLNIHHGFDPDKLAELLINQDFVDCKFTPCFVIRKMISAEIIKEYPVFLLTAYKA